MGLLTAISLFAGAGGLDLAAKRCGIRTVCYVEWDPYAQAVLMSRMRDGSLDRAPLWDDVTSFDGKPWRGKVDIVFGGFPCQPHSLAGHKRGGADERNLWPDTMRILRECGAWGFVGENVPGIITNGFAAQVLADLEREGFCGTPFSNSACVHGAPHTRERVFFVAHAPGIRRNSMEEKRQERLSEVTGSLSGQRFSDANRLLRDLEWSKRSPTGGVKRNDDGLAEGMDRLRLVGNGVCPDQAIPAFEKLKSWAGF